MKRIVFFSFHYNTGNVLLRDGKFLLFILNSSPSLEDYLDLTSLTTCQVPGRIKYSSARLQWYPKEAFYLVTTSQQTILYLRTFYLVTACQQTILYLCTFYLVTACQQTILYLHTFASQLGTVLFIPVHPYLLCCIFVWFCFLEIGSQCNPS